MRELNDFESGIEKAIGDAKKIKKERPQLQGIFTELDNATDYLNDSVESLGKLSSAIGKCELDKILRDYLELNTSLRSAEESMIDFLRSSKLSKDTDKALLFRIHKLKESGWLYLSDVISKNCSCKSS